MRKFKPGVSFGDFVVTDIKESKSRTCLPAGREQVVDYRRGWVIWLIILAAMGGILARLGALQLISGGKYRILADENRIKKIRLVAERGKILDRNGQDLRSWGEAAAHVVGYVGEVNEQEVGLLKEAGQKYELGSRIGRTGMEEQYEERLRGRDGGRLVEVDPGQKIVRELGHQEAEAGTDITLTLDAGLQQTAFVALGGKRGAVVVSDPKNGEVLALVSSPAFNPRQVTATSEFFNRGIGGVYPPGSVFKMVTAAAALESGKVKADFTYKDTGSINVGRFAYTNWYFTQYGRTEGVVGWEKAIARSVDTFFYKIGELTGAETMAAWAKEFGLGVKTGIDLPGEVAGLVPTPDWKWETKKEKWFLGNTYQMAIGQSDLLVTPLQVNVMTNVIAAGGEKCGPHLLKSQIPNPKSQINSNVSNSQCTKIDINPDILDIVKKGMIGACSAGGTAFPLFGFEPQVACKTGTAEYVRPDGKIGTHAWLTAFAPAEDPAISVTVLVEGGGEGSRVAAPIARKILAKYFGVEDKYNYAAVEGVGE
ncbi:MAG: Penicillin-binding protein 2 [Candidatus Amesbacteria bacterium GW2011_GWA2_47_70]|uniref:Penicillin-binding protein 2 n=1 Tax=Candidatus Amesbacteria bacterium GW2011_GWC2_45_19 TaxID=1618366 RepID=A0A0G1M2V5_9BACT|nr:MAG: Penicillin-binding protein 2 [Candidatus Amesbacteria bacterium GW2011_GWC2_45_19]KKU69023.1 MAG: Penicillin-binding protein 2 [Microgenomates group bacterium GW2011_GWC1_47_20]KKU80010.1 MAG: Penicillin-binding protein 2 [Candidatus Amesbacteria bacterium GW2011_GWA2_47_70]